MSEPERDDRGRFLPGNRGGPGNPSVRRLGELQAVIHEVVTPQRFRGLLVSLLKAAVEGDIQAARLLLDRVLGKPRSEPLAEAALDLPNGLESATDVSRAANAMIKGITAGTLAPEDAHRLAVVVELARRSLETQELERRISELEEQARREKHR